MEILLSDEANFGMLA